MTGVEYEDGGVVCNDDEMVVKNYTVWLGSKHIKYEQITPDDPVKVSDLQRSHGVEVHSSTS
ncbi:MAG: hypothetical protein M1121_01100 [Actinobacteria bacterium]|nr:hypothetical protein [Actinomycetota bacterium]